jgi:hypothetical protein
MERNMKIIKIKAKDFYACSNVQVGVLPYGEEVIHNAPPYRSQHNSASYHVYAENSGWYRIMIEYAAIEARPIQITFNGEVITLNALVHPTGGWEELYQKWSNEMEVFCRLGRNELQLSRTNVFPHIRTIVLVDRDIFGTLDEAALEREIIRSNYQKSE